MCKFNNTLKTQICSLKAQTSRYAFTKFHQDALESSQAPMEIHRYQTFHPQIKT